MSSRMLAVGAIILMFLVGGAGFGVFLMKMNKPIERWVSFPFSAQVEQAQKEALVAEWSEIAAQDEVLRAVVKKKKLVELWDTGSEDAAVKELRERSMVDLAQNGQNMRIVVKGLRKELEDLNEISGVLFQEIRMTFFAKYPNQQQPSNPAGN